MTDDRVRWYLWNWERYSLRHKSTSGSSGEGYPRRSLVFKGSNNSLTFEEMCRTADRISARAVDAIVDGLPQAQKLAVHHIHLASVFRLRNLEDTYDLARAAIGAGLERRGME